MLLRLDPDRNAIALLSLPRDLKVDIPGVGTDKLNAAYSLGGPKLTLADGQAAHGPRRSTTWSTSTSPASPAPSTRSAASTSTSTTATSTRTRPTPSSSRLRGDQPAARLPGALRVRRALLRALPPHRQRHRPRRPPAGVPARGPGQGASRAADRGPQEAGQDLHHLHVLGHRLRRADAAGAAAVLRPARARRSRRSTSTGTLGPSYVTATPDEIHTAVNQFLGSREHARARPGSTAKPSQKVTPGAGAGRARSRRRRPEASRAQRRQTDPDRTRATASSSPRGSGQRKQKVPIYYPTLLEIGSDYAQKPRVYKINGKGDQSPPHVRAGRLQVGLLAAHDRRLLRLRGDPLEGPADPRQPDRREDDRRPRLQALSTTATACGWSPGRPTRARSGSRTPSSRRSRTRTC